MQSFRGFMRQCEKFSHYFPLLKGHTHFFRFFQPLPELKKTILCNLLLICIILIFYVMACILLYGIGEGRE